MSHIYTFQKCIFKALIILFFSYSSAYAQGCSDAGICRVDALKPDANTLSSDFIHEIGIGGSLGAADYNITALAAHVSFRRTLGQSLIVESRLTMLGQNGNEISVFGMGDVFVNLTYAVSQKFSLTGGVKIPLMKADREQDELPLPMDYQSSLGTVDLLAGIKYGSEKWQIALATQIPLTHNENAFFPALYDPSSPLSAIQATNQFERQPDVLVHASRLLHLTDRISLSPGLLAIYHLADDKYTDMDGIGQSIEGSDGLTLNVTFHSTIDMDDRSALELQLGFPIVVRDARPDGLTRSFVFGAGYVIRF